MSGYSNYNPKTRRINLAPDASLYCRFHELAHKEQHESAKWRICFAARFVRGFNWIITLLIEYNAYRRARRVMERIGIWSAEAEIEARDALRAYITRKELPNVRPSLT